MEIVEGGKGNLPNKISYKKGTWNAPDIQKLSPQLYIPVVHFRTQCMCGAINFKLFRVGLICCMKDTFLYISFRMQSFYEQQHILHSMYGILCLSQFLTCFGRNCHRKGRRNFGHKLKHCFTLNLKIADVKKPSKASEVTNDQKIT